MQAEPLFVSQKSGLAEDLLIGWRCKLDVQLERAFVVLACLSDACIDPPGGTDFGAVFNGMCLAAFRENSGHFPQRPNGRPDSIACAWFEERQDALVAATRIQQGILRLMDSRQTVMIAVGIDEISAFRLLRLAGDDQVIVHPDIWDALSNDAQAVLIAANVHKPDLGLRKAATAAIADRIIRSIPWGELPPVAHLCDDEDEPQPAPSASVTA